MTKDEPNWKHWTLFTILGMAIWVFIFTQTWRVFDNHISQNVLIQLIQVIP